MMKSFKTFLISLTFLFLYGFSLEADQKAVEESRNRQITQLKSYYRAPAGTSQIPSATIGVELYNQAVLYYQNQDYDLAEQTLSETISVDPRNSYAYELLGDIQMIRHELPGAKANYKNAYMIKPSESLKSKINRVNREMQISTEFRKEETEKFLLEFRADKFGPGLEEIKAMIDEVYMSLKEAFAIPLRNKLVVVFYSQDEFMEVTQSPHWVGGSYDGKVRLPSGTDVMDLEQLSAIAMHEMTHAFVAALSANQAPPWINEGLAEYQENRVFEKDRLVFRSAVKTKSLFSLDQLMVESGKLSDRDPLYASLFYDQSFALVNYMMEQYGMFKMIQLLRAFGEGQNSEEALQFVLGMGIEELESQWINSL